MTGPLDWKHIALAVALLTAACVMGTQRIISGGDVFAVLVAVGALLGVSVGVSGASHAFGIGRQVGAAKHLPDQ